VKEPVANGHMVTEFRAKQLRGALSPSATSSECCANATGSPWIHVALRMRASAAVTPKQVMMGWSALETIPKSTGSACDTMGQAAISFTAAEGTLLKNRSETLRSKTMISLSLDRMPENMPIAPCRMVTTVSMAATLNAMPVTLMSDRMRCRRRFVTISVRKIMNNLQRSPGKCLV
jgi:hypothetical protein